jgi:hypothetical protein
MPKNVNKQKGVFKQNRGSFYNEILRQGYGNLFQNDKLQNHFNKQ